MQPKQRFTKSRFLVSLSPEQMEYINIHGGDFATIQAALLSFMPADFPASRAVGNPNLNKAKSLLDN